MSRLVNVERMRRYAQRGSIGPEWRDLPPAVKVQIVEAMGFSPSRAGHADDCPRLLDSGYTCMCAGEPTRWTGPQDVQQMRGETWEQRVAERRSQHL